MSRSGSEKKGRIRVGKKEINRLSWVRIGARDSSMDLT